MAKSTKVFSLEGKGLKLDTAKDLEPHIEPLREMSDVEEIRLLGNSLGVEACKDLGEVLETKKSLQVSFFCVEEACHACTTKYRALLTWHV
jgi:Ran GTPase-activating protein 1